MDLHRALYGIAKQLVMEEDADRTAEAIFRLVLEVTGADRGFIVVREGGSFQQKLDLRFDRAEISADDRRFSRTLVREAIERRQLLHLPGGDAARDARFPHAKSVHQIGAAATLVVPFVGTKPDAEVVAVIYLDRTRGRGDFPDHVPAFLTELAELAAAFVQRALERKALHDRARTLENDLLSQYDFEGIVTRDPAMLALLATVAQVADSTASVLIRGETGTGKELVARALHVNSPRKARPFVVLHCTALPATLLESELFGHARGAFSGADRDRSGRVASAHGGTLFLDEVAEIPLEAQAKLLRFLQFGEIQRLGSDRVDKVDVRVLSATHQDLGALIEQGRFRQDLYYRLKVVEVDLPPLRARKGDLALLVDSFLRRSAQGSKTAPRISAEALRALEAYSFPGNVRELSHLVERACVLCRGPEVLIEHLPREVLSAAAGGEGVSGSAGVPGAGAPSRVSGAGAAPGAGAGAGTAGARFSALTGDELESVRAQTVSEVEREFLTALLKKHGGNVSLAAREAAMHRSYLQKLLSKHGIGAKGGAS